MSVNKFISGLFTSPFETLQTELMKERKNYDKSQFTKYFISLDIPEIISSTVWDILISESSVDCFKPYHSDNIPDVFGIVDEDFDDLIVNSINSCGKKIPEDNILEKMRPIGDVNSLILFVNKCENK